MLHCISLHILFVSVTLVWCVVNMGVYWHLPLLPGRFQSHFSCQTQRFCPEVFWDRCSMELRWSDPALQPEREQGGLVVMVHLTFLCLCTLIVHTFLFIHVDEIVGNPMFLYLCVLCLKTWSEQYRTKTAKTSKGCGDWPEWTLDPEKHHCSPWTWPLPSGT